MAKASREFVYGLNPAFELLRAGKRRVFAAHLNEGMRHELEHSSLLGRGAHQELGGAALFGSEAPKVNPQRPDCWDPLGAQEHR